MLSLKTIGERENQTTVTLRGREVTVRGLTLAERVRLQALFPPPRPPVGKNPARGDRAREEPLLDDPDYRRAVAEHVALSMAVEFIIATGWETADGTTWDSVAEDGARQRPFLKTAAAELGQAGIGRPEVEAVLDAAERVESGRGNARGN